MSVNANDDSGDSEWRSAAYEQFLREDPPEDSVYEPKKELEISD